ncbi:MAG: hypothetical protein IPK33_23515 [Gemmatimonadetes bacterium]|nr:hypothetical protein [Gemmatimonadota bacterium]
MAHLSAHVVGEDLEGVVPARRRALLEAVEVEVVDAGLVEEVGRLRATSRCMAKLGKKTLYGWSKSFPTESPAACADAVVPKAPRWQSRS